MVSTVRIPRPEKPRRPAHVVAGDDARLRCGPATVAQRREGTQPARRARSGSRVRGRGGRRASPNSRSAPAAGTSQRRGVDDSTIRTVPPCRRALTKAPSTVSVAGPAWPPGSRCRPRSARSRPRGRRDRERAAALREELAVEAGDRDGVELARDRGARIDRVQLPPVSAKTLLPSDLTMSGSSTPASWTLVDDESPPPLRRCRARAPAWRRAPSRRPRRRRDRARREPRRRDRARRRSVAARVGDQPGAGVNAFSRGVAARLRAPSAGAAARARGEHDEQRERAHCADPTPTSAAALPGADVEQVHVPAPLEHDVVAVRAGHRVRRGSAGAALAEQPAVAGGLVASIASRTPSPSRPRRVELTPTFVASDSKTTHEPPAVRLGAALAPLPGAPPALLDASRRRRLRPGSGRRGDLRDAAGATRSEAVVTNATMLPSTLLAGGV